MVPVPASKAKQLSAVGAAKAGLASSRACAERAAAKPMVKVVSFSFIVFVSLVFTRVLRRVLTSLLLDFSTSITGQASPFCQ